MTDVQISRQFDSRAEARIETCRTLRPGAHVHVIGACGTGMASVLVLLKQQGFYVSGSDKAFYPPMGQVVREHADKVYEGYAAGNIDEATEFVVIGNSVVKENPEVVETLRRELPFASMPEVLSGRLIGSKEECSTSVVVTGTHGKTTTTAAITTVLDELGYRPGFFVGGIALNFSSSLRQWDKSLPVEERVVVLEGDEYDSAFFAKYSKFHSYRPQILVLTSLEFDHADIFASVEEIEAEFDRLVARMSEDSVLLLCRDNEGVRRLGERWISKKATSANVLWYGEAAGSDFRLVSRRVADEAGGRIQECTCDMQGSSLSFKTGLLGLYNASNLVAASAVALLCGAKALDIGKAVERFRGVKRRQEVRAESGGITLLEDFAHHPTAIEVTLKGIRERFPSRRLIAVYEPRSNTSRRAVFADRYREAFMSADVVLLAEVPPGTTLYDKAGGKIELLDVPKVAQTLEAEGKIAKSLPTPDSIYDFLAGLIRAGDVVVLMSNGDFGGLPSRLTQLIENAGR